MFLNRLTISGADDAVRPEDLAGLTHEFPFVEWGILLSKSREGTPRYPSTAWCEAVADFGLPIAGHLCGRWLRDLVAGEFTYKEDRPWAWRMLGRLQLNFARHPVPYGVDLVRALLREAEGKQAIFQMDGINDPLMAYALDNGVDAVPFFDQSGGTGQSPDFWPRPYLGMYCGYAGGLNMINLGTQLRLIAAHEPDQPFWADIESGVRDGDNFDLERVRACLEIARNLIRG